MALTYKHKFNKHYGYTKDTAHSIGEISKLTGFKLSGLKTILKKGQGAYYSNPTSVRKHITNSTEWGIARVYSAVMGGKAAVIDASHLIKKK